MAESTVSEEEFSWSLAQALKDFSVESLLRDIILFNYIIQVFNLLCLKRQSKLNVSVA